MFDPYAESLSSTGEPPTAPRESSRNNLYSTQTLCSGNNTATSHGEMSVSPLSSGTRSRTLSVQEPDSGYEASPSSLVDNQRFFGEQSVVVVNPMELLQSCNLNPDEEFDFLECHSQSRFSESESDLEDYDTCQDCYSSICSCCRTDSSSTNATAISNCDNSRCNSSELSFNRPSSQPIQVPNQQSCRISPEIRSRLEHSMGSLLDMYHEARSLPIRGGPLHSLGLIPENYPLSWPSIAHSSLNNRRRNPALPSPRNHISLNRDIPNRCSRYNHPRSRRQLIDSEASSFCSSDDEGPEDVFNMSGEDPSSFLMTSAGSVPLPDLVLESTDSGRRGRSVSVNLPLERRLEVIRGVGQRLRRMSDLFDQRRELCIAVMHIRSRRASDCFDTRPNGES